MTILYNCVCDNGSSKNDALSCDDCETWCKDGKGGMTSCLVNTTGNTPAVFLGLTLGVFFAILVITIVVWVLMIWFSVHVMKKCGGKPAWLNPTLITLLVLFFLGGWIPGLGFVFFVALLVLLIVYNNNCKGKKH